jgi:adenosylcobinamide-phosphate synthase
MTIPTLIIILFFLNMVTNFWLYVVVNIVLISPLLAARSLYTHVNDIYKKLNEDDLTNSRAALAKIVGRDVKNLSEKNICKAAIESLAESTADGVIAPLFWAVIFGFPGILMYKIVNTLDSMVGYKNVRFSDFGWASAKLDDIINWIPARLTAILFSFLTLKPIETLSFSWRNSTVSPSPNAGWPQAAMAFALNISLMGSKTYGELVVKQITINETFPSPTRQNLFEALKFYKNTVVLSLAILLMVYVLESVIA